MNQEQIQKAVPVFFIVGGIAFAYSSIRPDVDAFAMAFGIGAGLVAAGYGVFRMLQQRRRDRERTLDEGGPDDGAAGPPPP